MSTHPSKDLHLKIRQQITATCYNNAIKMLHMATLPTIKITRGGGTGSSVCIPARFSFATHHTAQRTMAWCTIESDPGVFSELITAFGAKGVQVEELWALDDDVFAPLRPIYGLFFLFKWEAGKGGGAGGAAAGGAGSGGAASASAAAAAAAGEDADHVFFCQQTITNACGTIALLHVLLNNPDIDIGETLTEYKAFASALPPDMRGQVLGMYSVAAVRRGLGVGATIARIHYLSHTHAHTCRRLRPHPHCTQQLCAAGAV